MNNGTCSINQQLGTFQCQCPNGWEGVRCSYRKFYQNNQNLSTKIFYLKLLQQLQLLIPVGNNTNLTTIINQLFPNATNGTIQVQIIQ